MTELERTKAALAEVLARFNQVCRATDFDAAQRAITAILSPPVEMETVPLERWANVSSENCIMGIYDSERSAADWCMPDCVVVKLTGSYQWPKPQRVERSVEVEVKIWDGKQYVEGIPLTVNGNQHAFTNHHECHGKTGLLTFTWQE